MDFNAGRLLYEPMEDVLADFIQAIIAVASGTKTRNEANNVREIAIFKNGVTFINEEKREANVLNDDFLLTNDFAKDLYHQYAKKNADH